MGFFFKYIYNFIYVSTSVSLIENNALFLAQIHKYRPLCEK